MDLSHLTAAQMLPENRLVFDPEEIDRAVLRAQERRRVLRRLWLAVMQSPKAIFGSATRKIGTARAEAAPR